MSTLSLSAFLSNHEDGSGLRHPFVAICHLPFAIALLAIGYFTAENVGQAIYFVVVVELYLISTLQHSLQPNWWVNFIDQSSIGWYVAAVPLPFTYHEWWAIPLFFALGILITLSKGLGWERNSTVSNLLFLAMGVVSFGLMLAVGLPSLGAGLWSHEAHLVYAATGFFLLALIIYHSQWPTLVRRYWGPPENKHFCLALAVSIYTYLVVTYPV